MRLDAGLLLVFSQERFPFPLVLFRLLLPHFFLLMAGFHLIGAPGVLRLLFRQLQIAAGQHIFDGICQDIHVQVHAAAFDSVANVHANGVTPLLYLLLGGKFGRVRRRIRRGRLVIRRHRHGYYRQPASQRQGQS